ncbi:CaiB/BaiF CoA transferase family protein [Rhodococcoides corynebacterioides]|uniref:CaiB/BaiF CoA transferase family protein n=1 Tax=Rhodococcoides corynebacterioides TaxID=53972 RepID=UPI003AE814E5
MTLPLEGYTVVAIEQAVAAPLATRNLVDLGARVIKIERVDGGDLARGYDHAVEGTGAHFVWLNRGKESLALDLKDPAARAVVRALVAQADVFVQNLAPGAAERLGFGAAELRAEQPSLVTASISGFGSGGPMSDRKSYDMLIQAEAGLVSITGSPDAPAKTGIPTADIASGMYCAQSVLAALLRRARTGVGARIDISMLDATVEWLGHAMYTQLYTGTPPPRMGLSHTSIAPYDAFPTADGSMLIGVQNDRGWRTLVTDVLRRPELADDPRFLTNVARVAHRAECDAVVAACTEQWTTADLDAALADAGIPAAQVKRMDQVVEHPQITERDRWRTIRTEFTTARAVLPPSTFGDFEAPMGDVPALGQHTLELLREAGVEDPDSLLDRGVAHTPHHTHDTEDITC